ncbi:MAG: NUDIX hydrolase [bacterium]
MKAQGPVAGAGVVVLCGPRALLVRRAKPPRAGEWSLPGGRQEWGEPIREAARRELFEETGLRAETLHLLDVVDGILPGRGSVEHHFTLIDFWTEITEELARTARAGGDAAELRWAAPEEIERLADWAETRRVCRLAFARRDAAAARRA